MAAPMLTSMNIKEQLQFPIKRIVIHIKYRDAYRLWKKCIVTPLLNIKLICSCCKTVQTCFFYLFLKLIQINYIFSDNVRYVYCIISIRILCMQCHSVSCRLSVVKGSFLPLMDISWVTENSIVAVVRISFKYMYNVTKKFIFMNKFQFFSGYTVKPVKTEP